MKTHIHILSTLRSLRRQFEGNERIKHLCSELETTIYNLIEGAPNRLTNYQFKQMELNAAVERYVKEHPVKEFNEQRRGVRRNRATRIEKLFLDEKMNFKVRRELHRYGLLDRDNTLRISGRELRSLYRWLERERIVVPLRNMTDVLYAFKKEFSVKKSVRSLQGIRDDDADINAWDNIFLMLHNPSGKKTL